MPRSNQSTTLVQDVKTDDRIGTELPSELDRRGALRGELRGDLFHGILSKSPLMVAVFHLIADMANAKATVLIEGETGTGKELVARAIHVAAAESQGAFVAVNCAALPEALLESELFGHEKGAFTSAIGRRRGRFEMAQGGSIFLDEVGDMPAVMQAKLLRVLQERSFERVGGTETINVDARVIAATNRYLPALVKKGQFREDLFYRLNVIKIDLPPLRLRPEDLPLLAAHFIAKYSRPGVEAKRMSAPALEALLHHSWPGNVRELENAIERACVTSRGMLIEVADLPAEVIAPAPPPPCLLSIDMERSLADQVREAVAHVESQFIRRALARTHGHVGRCARMCGLSRRSISSRIAKYHLRLQ